MGEKERENEELSKRLDTLEREMRLISSDDEPKPMMSVKGDFFQVINALRSLDQEENSLEIERISNDIENGNIKVDMAELFFRFFIRQEIQNSRIKLLLLAKNIDMDPELFDKLDDLTVLVEDGRISIHQIIIGWKSFEREVAKELKRLRSNKRS